MDGRPMPCSSSALTSEASEKRGGGSVKCCSPCRPSSLTSVAFLHRRQHVVVVVVGGAVVATFLVDRDEAGLHQRRAVGAQHVCAAAARRPRCMSTATVSNTACAIWQAMARFQISAYSLNWSASILPSTCCGRDRGRGRAHGLVRFLRVLRLGLVDARLFGEAFLAVELLDRRADLGHGLGRRASPSRYACR